MSSAIRCLALLACSVALLQCVPLGQAQYQTNGWPNGVIPYTFVGNFSTENLATIQQAIQTLESSCCVSFQEVAADCTACVRITYNSGPDCTAGVGYRRLGSVLTHGTNCANKLYMIVHELLQVIGLFNQHKVPGRDNAITVNLANVKPNRVQHFNIVQAASDFGLPYDYDSLVHGPPKLFSDNGLPTMVPLLAGAVIGQRDHLSVGDIAKCNILYNCYSAEPTTEATVATTEGVDETSTTV